MPWVALADLGDTEGFEKGGEEGQLYAFELFDGVYKRKKRSPSKREVGRRNSERSDVDVSYAVPRRLHTPAFTWSKWVAFADPVQETGWMIDIRISSPYVSTRQHHKVRKVTNSGIRLCSYVPETKNVVVSRQYTLKTSNSRVGIISMVSELSSGNTYSNNPSRGDPRRPAPRLRRSFARLQAQIDQRAHGKSTWGLHHITGATYGALYLGGGNPA